MDSHADDPLLESPMWGGSSPVRPRDGIGSGGAGGARKIDTPLPPLLHGSGNFIGQEGSGASTAYRHNGELLRGSSNSTSVGGGHNFLVSRRIIVEEEASLRSRIYLQQLESWKNLRVEACNERMALHSLEDRSVSFMSYSVMTRDGRGASSSGRTSTVSPRNSVQCPQTPSDRTMSPPLRSESRNTAGSLLERFYDGEVLRAASRRARLHERERQSIESAERRKAMEDLSRMRREAVERSRREETALLRRREYEARQRLQEEEVQLAKAMEGVQHAANRAEAAEMQLGLVSKALESATVWNRAALEGLLLREQQVDLLSEDVERLKIVNEAFRQQHIVFSELQKHRIAELESNLLAFKRREEESSRRLQGAVCDLAEGRKAWHQQENALHESLQELKLIQQQKRDVEQQLHAVKSSNNQKCGEANEHIKRLTKELEESQALCVELEHRCNERDQAIKDQAARYETILATKESAADASLAQLQSELSVHRFRAAEVQEEWAKKCAAMSASAETQMKEIERLQRALDELRVGAIRSREQDAVELKTCQERMREETVRNDEADRLLRIAGTEISKLHAALAGSQEELNSLQARCDGLTTALQEAQQQCSRDTKDVEKLRQIERELKAALRDEESARLLAEGSHRDAAEKHLEEQRLSRRLKKEVAALQKTVTVLRQEVERGQNGGSKHYSDRRILFSPCSEAVEERRGTGALQPAQLYKGHSACYSPSYADGHPGLRSMGSDAELRGVAGKVADAINALHYARNQAVRQEKPATGLPFQNRSQGTADSVAVADCAAKLTEAVKAVNMLLSHLGFRSLQNKFSKGPCDIDRQLVELLKQHRRALEIVLRELNDAKSSNPQRPSGATPPAVAVLAEDPLIKVLVAELSERLAVLEARSSGDVFTTSSSPLSLLSQADDGVNGEGYAEASATEVVRRLNMDDAGKKALPRHTFGFTGGRLTVSRNGTRLQRLLLPGVVDIMSCSALGTLDHHTFLTLFGTTSSPLLFEFTVCVGTRCDGVLVGFADRYLPLEGFGGAQNSLKYTNCYFFHLGRGTLYCQAQRMLDAPYPGLQRFSSAAIQVGEEISCVLDVVAQTIRFRRNGSDCGIAFEHVCLTRALFPAFEVNSRGCTLDFV